MRSAILAAASSSDHSILQNIGEVVLYGALAGIGLSIAFSLMVRGFLVAGVARREGQEVRAIANTGMAIVFAIVCVAAIAGAIAVMLHR